METTKDHLFKTIVNTAPLSAHGVTRAPILAEPRWQWVETEWQAAGLPHLTGLPDAGWAKGSTSFNPAGDPGAAFCYWGGDK